MAIRLEGDGAQSPRRNGRRSRAMARLAELLRQRTPSERPTVPQSPDGVIPPSSIPPMPAPEEHPHHP